MVVCFILWDSGDAMNRRIIYCTLSRIEEKHNNMFMSLLYPDKTVRRRLRLILDNPRMAREICSFRRIGI